jgi:hypothetical protein
MFPAGAPGVALLVLRNCIALALYGMAFSTGWQHGMFLILLAMLCVGLLTPAACVLAAATVLLDQQHLRGMHNANLVVVVLSTLSLALLGPGSFSIDARLFGRRILVSASAGDFPRNDSDK